MTKYTTSLFSLAIAAVLITTGCESSDNSAVTWNTATASVDNSSASNTQNNTKPSTGSSSASDQVSFGSLQWVYGGINGAGASHSGVSISSMSISGPPSENGNVSWKYNSNLSAWGVSFDDHTKAYFCFFVKERDGVWRGGKLDWISSSRSSRNFHNISGKYLGWRMNANSPAQVAMLILHTDCKRRSNVITTTWAF